MLRVGPAEKRQDGFDHCGLQRNDNYVSFFLRYERLAIKPGAFCTAGAKGEGTRQGESNSLIMKSLPALLMVYAGVLRGRQRFS